MGISEEAPGEKVLLQHVLLLLLLTLLLHLALWSSVGPLIVFEATPDWRLCGIVYRLLLPLQAVYFF